MPKLAVQGRTQKERLTGKPVKINLDGIPLPSFINEVYGNILGLSFEIDSSLRQKQDLVTLRTEEALSPSKFDALARQVLGNYGVAVQRNGRILRFVPSRGTVTGEPPLLISGQALPEVPLSHRPVFQMVSLKVVRNVHVAGWLRQVYKGQKLQISEDPERNAVLLMGAPNIVGQAIKAARFLDRPYMRGRHSIRIEPVFLKAGELAKLLVDVLNTEGYSASLKPPLGSIIVLPVEAVNALLVFTADASILGHVRDWAGTLDRPGIQIGSKTGFYYYQVQNTRASELAEVLGKVLGYKDTKDKQSGRLVVDEVRNSLLFQGEKKEWNSMLPVIREMDKPARMVLIEVTVAEITLNDTEELGIEWIFKDIGMDDVKGVLGTYGGLGVGASGLSFTLDNAGRTRAILNAFASRSRVSILSTPRVMVKSGGKATIDVGTEVPVITSQSTSELQQNGTSGLLQEIQYRKTGVLLTVSPVVHSNNRIDLEICQEVSETQPDAASKISSPSIFTRKIDTSLGLNDGGSVLLGGLISTTKNQGYTGIPVLSKIPLAGRLFRVEKQTEVRTELVMLIIPYVIDSGRDAVEITESFQRQLQRFSIDTNEK